jgi:hypothetical protein
MAKIWAWLLRRNCYVLNISSEKLRMKSSPTKNKGGRPAKFAEPSYPVTITLPERVLGLLATVDSDRAKAIVKLVDRALVSGRKAPGFVEIVRVAPGKAIILVGCSRYLARIPWLRLVEVAPARNLISVLPGTSIETLEVALHDLLEEVPPRQTIEREMLEKLWRTLRESRRGRKTSKEEILFVDLGN